MPANHFNIKGLSSEEVVFAREKFGDNALNPNHAVEIF